MGEVAPLSIVGFAAVGCLSEGSFQGEPALMLWPDVPWGAQLLLTAYHCSSVWELWGALDC